ncbi:stAR-related lipid transfer protein 6-like [Saccoglossus kowalevskii]
MDIENHHKWNSSIESISVIEQINEDMKVIYSVTPSHLGGLVSHRDFCDLVGVRHFQEKDVHVIYDVSVDHPECPPVKKYVRARNYPSGHLLYKVDGDPNKTRIVDFIQSEMHLSPKALIDRLIPFLIPAYLKDLSNGVKEL